MLSNSGFGRWLRDVWYPAATQPQEVTADSLGKVFQTKFFTIPHKRDSYSASLVWRDALIDTLGKQVVAK